MNHRPRYIPGDYLMIDDMSGFVIRRSQARKQWNGLIVDKKDWEAEHPQNYLRAIPDDSSVPEPRPEATDTFYTTDSWLWEDGGAIQLEDNLGNWAPETDDNWLLLDGLWDDTGYWIDSAVWEDS